jgi:endonuclease-3
MPEFKKVIAKLKRHYGEPALPPAKGPFELILWENACYLLPDERRATVFEGLRQQIGFDPYRIQDADRDVLLTLAKMGGMRPQTRVFRWLEIARITITQFGGNLDRILNEPYSKAKKALTQFPNIGDPGAEKILLYCGMGPGLPLDWNGCRVLLRLGFGREHRKNYAARYRSIQEALEGQLPKDAAALALAHLLLRQHGKEICRNNGPMCHECPIANLCIFAANPQARRATSEGRSSNSSYVKRGTCPPAQIPRRETMRPWQAAAIQHPQSFRRAAEYPDRQ